MVSLIMRFRDIGTTNAINEHKRIRDKFGYCWAGWWSDENCLSVEKLSELQKTLKDENTAPCFVFLLNSSTRTLYKATCTQIKFSKKGRNIKSPEKEKFPAYYSSRKTPLWFKYTSIKKIDESNLLGQYSYCNSKEYPTSTKDSYSCYDDRVINSIKEILDQNRTLIFIREKEKNDKSVGNKNIPAYQYNEPVYFAEEYASSNTNAILLLSDIHFSRRPGRCIFKDNHELSDAIIELHENSKEKFDNLIVAGDLTWSGEKAEFKMADFVFQALKDNQTISMNWDRIAIVPGNHDIKFSRKKSKQNKQLSAPSYTKKNYEQFYKDIYDKKPNEHCCFSKRIILKNNLKIEIICLNSNVLEQIKGQFEGIGCVDDKQLKMVGEELDKKKGDEPSFRILVLHHHLIPVVSKEEPRLKNLYSLTLDSGKISDFIVKYRINLVIHGHEHEEFIAKVGKKIDNKENRMHEYYIVGLGSVGVVKDQRAKYVHNTAGILSFLENDSEVRVQVSIKEIHHRPFTEYRPILEHTFPILSK